MKLLVVTLLAIICAVMIHESITLKIDKKTGIKLALLGGAATKGALLLSKLKPKHQTWDPWTPSWPSWDPWAAPAWEPEPWGHVVLSDPWW